MTLELLLYTSENSQIPLFSKIYDKLILFWKYLAIYNFFSTRVSQNWVVNSTRVPSELPADLEFVELKK